MNRLLLSACLLLAVFAAVVPSFADTASANGVLAEERVVNLPNDQGKWYISVVGNANDTAYLRVLGWFEANPSLKGLKNKVHYCPVTTGTPIYQERYAPNMKGLPTVRVQKADGVVVYEAAGSNLPMTAEGLYGAIAGAVSNAQGLRPILPWRRDMERRCPGPGPCPTPNPQPNPDPQPDPAQEPAGGAPDAPEPSTPAAPGRDADPLRGSRTSGVWHTLIDKRNDCFPNIVHTPQPVRFDTLPPYSYGLTNQEIRMCGKHPSFDGNNSTAPCSKKKPLLLTGPASGRLFYPKIKILKLTKITR